MKPLVVIILVNYNGYRDTVECLDSLNDIDYDNFQIVVVDNGSTVMDTESVEYIKHCSHYVYSEENLGFSGGNNLGIKYAEKNFSPEFYLLINNDTLVTKGFLDALVDAHGGCQGVGLVCGKIYYYSEPRRIWYAGGAFDWKRGYANHLRYNEFEDRDDEPLSVEDVKFATGCLWLIPEYTIEKVGLMSEDYFLYCEDTDYCCRILNTGMRIIYTNKAIIYHKVGQSSKNSESITYYMIRNNMYIAKKYSTNKAFGYLFHLELTLKSVIAGENKITGVMKGISDFFKGRTGKRKAK